jgi:hypothetical protein
VLPVLPEHKVPKVLKELRVLFKERLVVKVHKVPKVPKELKVTQS